MPPATPSPLPAEAPQKDRLTDRKRQSIIQAAIDEFRTHGFSATSMDRVAATASVSKRTVYNHFPSKEALFAEILVQLWDSSAAQVDLAYHPDRPLRAQLLELLWQKMRMLCDASFVDLARVAIAETIHSPERAQEMVARLGDREEGVTLWLRAATADGQLKLPDPVFAAHQLQGLIKSFAFWPQVTMGQATLPPALQQQVVESAVDMFLACYS